MRTVGLKVLKNRLSEYVRIASGGETVLVTDRDKVVAELVPPREGRRSAANDSLISELVPKGWMTPARAVREDSPPSLPVAPLAEILEELDRDRSDR
jgi:antitoxin (DNA-binding transcriptional repressor) of toxin-antitoxin stability system